MVKMKVNPDEYVKKEKMYIVAVVALLLGFIGGVIYSEHSPGAGHSDEAIDHAAQHKFPDIAPANLQKNEITMLEKEVSANSKNAEAWTQLGNKYFDTNQVPKAINAYERSLKLKPNNANTWTDLGVMYRRNNQHVEAIAAFNKAVKIDPKHQISRLNIGVVLLYDLDDKKGAIKAWEGLLKINPSAKTSNGQSINSMVQELKSESH